MTHIVQKIFFFHVNSEQEIFKEEIHSLKGVKDKLQGRIKDLEEELKKTKEDLEKKAQQAQEGENEVCSPDCLNDFFITQSFNKRKACLLVWGIYPV